MYKFCCTNCFSDSEIKRFIEAEDNIGECNYCESNNVHVCNVSEVGDFIMQGVNRYYEDAANQVGYCSAEGGYLLPTNDISDILIDSEEIFSERIDDPFPLLEDLVVLDSTPYVRKDPYGPPDNFPEEIYYWETFCKTIKTQKRFTTFLSIEGNKSYDLSEPDKFLFYLASTFMPELITIIPVGEKIYRARIQKKNKEYLHEDLTAPESDKSRNNRMSPAGIPFFYGAVESKTCIHEVRPTIDEEVIVAEFETIKQLLVLDLARELEKRKSIFSEDFYFQYEVTFKPFLKHFAYDISRPIRKSDNDIEYTPTQVFTEFIKTLNFKDQFYLPYENGQESDVYLNGIFFKSSIRDKGTNIVLFRGHDISTTDLKNNPDSWLLYKGQKTYMITGIDFKYEND